MLATGERVDLARSVRRIPIEERWCDDNVEWVQLALWHRYKGDEYADGIVPEGVTPEERGTAESIPERVIFVNTRLRPPSEFPITRKDAEELGTTRGCPGCVSWYRGNSRAPHTEQCRARFREAMKDRAKVKNVEIRRQEFAAKMEAKRFPK